MALTTLVRQVGRVRRRLFLGSLLTLLAWFWVAALALSAGWFFVQPYLLNEAPEWLRWTVLGASVGVATVLAITLSVLRAPSQVGAALSLDEKFGLRERVTTTLTLAPDQSATPAGQALLADVESRLAQVRVADRFPIALPWKPAALLPACAAAITLLALLWNPTFDTSRLDASTDPPTPAEAKAAVEEQMKKLAANKQPGKKEDKQLTSAELKNMEEEIEKFTLKPRETRDEIRDRIKDATALENELRRQQQQQVQRADAMREAMKQAERLARKNRQKDGPARDAADAIAKGDMAKAKDELERLSRELEKEEKKERLKRKLRDPNTSKEEKEQLQRELDELGKDSKLSDKDKEDLQKQLEDMKDMVERLSRKKEEVEKELREKEKNGEIDKEELERELEQLEKNKLTKEEIEELKELAEELAECEKCMKEGKDGEAAKKLAQAAKKCEGMCKDGDNAARAKMLARMQAVRKALNRSMAGVGAGRRPEAKSDTAHKDEHVPGEWDKGKVEVVGSGPKGGKKFDGPKKPTDMKEEIKEAGQEAAAAIDRQRLPPSARKMARDYFEKVRGQDKGKDGKKK
jgi:hypothetical protein